MRKLFFRFEDQAGRRDPYGLPVEFSHPEITAQTRANDLAIYGPVTDPGGPAMTWVKLCVSGFLVYSQRKINMSRVQGMFAVGYIELGPTFATQAASNFNRSFANAQVGLHSSAVLYFVFVDAVHVCVTLLPYSLLSMCGPRHPLAEPPIFDWRRRILAGQ